MKDRYQLVKDEIMHIMKCTPAANYSVSSLHDRLKNKVTRTEIDRAVACLLSRQHITRVKRHTYGLGETKPYDLSEYDEKALPDMTSPAMSNKQRIAEAEKRREQQQQNKSFKHWSGGEQPSRIELIRPHIDPKEIPAIQKSVAHALAANARILHIPTDKARTMTEEADVNYALSQLELRMAKPTDSRIQDLKIKLNVLDRLALIADDPVIGGVLEQIKTDLKGIN